MKRAMSIWLGLGVALCATTARADRFALVIGENEPAAGSGLAPLRFADDDALRHAAWLKAAGAHVETLVVLDEATQRKFPGAAAGTRPPTLETLKAAMLRLNSAMRVSRAAGRSVDFHFVFAGHGEVGPSGEGRMHLRDGPLTRAALLSEVVATSQADFNHLTIDACNAQTLVFSRGAGEPDDGWRPDDYRATISKYLSAQDLRAYPNTGAMLASTAGRESHEWEAIEAGVFSHQVRSGLAGAADTNGDGAVEYSELAAWIQAANDAIADPALRPQVVFQPPTSNLNRPVLTYAAVGRAFLKLPRGFTGRAWLEDGVGGRYADVNTSGEVPVMLALGDAPTYWLRRGDDEARIDVRGPGVIDEARLTWRPRGQQSRGARGEAFERHLFERPFGPSFYAGFVSSAGHVPAVQQSGGAFPAESVTADAEPAESGAPRRVLTWVTSALAVGAGAASVWSGLDAADASSGWRRRFTAEGVDDRQARGAHDDAVTRAWIFGGVGVASGLAAAGLWLWRSESDTNAVGVAPSPGGVDVYGRF